MKALTSRIVVRTELATMDHAYIVVECSLSKSCEHRCNIPMHLYVYVIEYTNRPYCMPISYLYCRYFSILNNIY
jgi:hypothetical protein